MYCRLRLVRWRMPYMWWRTRTRSCAPWSVSTSTSSFTETSTCSACASTGWSTPPSTEESPDTRKSVQIPPNLTWRGLKRTLFLLADEFIVLTVAKLFLHIHLTSFLLPKWMNINRSVVIQKHSFIISCPLCFCARRSSIKSTLAVTQRIRRRSLNSRIWCRNRWTPSKLLHFNQSKESYTHPRMVLIE